MRVTSDWSFFVFFFVFFSPNICSAAILLLCTQLALRRPAPSTMAKTVAAAASASTTTTATNDRCARGVGGTKTPGPRLYLCIFSTAAVTAAPRVLPQNTGGTRELKKRLRLSAIDVRHSSPQSTRTGRYTIDGRRPPSIAQPLPSSSSTIAAPSRCRCTARARLLINLVRLGFYFSVVHIYRI